MPQTEMLPYCPVYTANGYSCTDMRDVCRHANELAINIFKPTGFRQIDIIPPQKLWDKKYRYLVNHHRINHVKSNHDIVADKIIKSVKDFFQYNWDSNDIHMVWASGGIDSRIMSIILKILENENGKDWLGDVRFVCHQPEGIPFKKAMKNIGWKKHQYHVHKGNNKNKSDYYDYGDFSVNCNAFHPHYFGFWSEIIDMDDWKDTVIVAGGWGNRMLDPRYHYPPNYPRQKTEWQQNHPINHGIPFNDVYYNWPFTFSSQLFMNYKDLIDPFATYGMAEIMFNQPQTFFYHDVRVNILRKLNAKPPFSRNTGYNFKMSRDRKKYMKKMYHGSRFYSDFMNRNNYVKRAMPWNFRIFKINTATKLYGLATMYERI